MSTKPHRKPVKIRARQSYPKLSATDQKTITLFLEWYKLIATQAVEKTQAASKRNPSEAVFANQYRYWSDVVSGIDWLLTTVTYRQKYLEIQRCLDLDPNFSPTQEPVA